MISNTRLRQYSIMETTMVWQTWFLIAAQPLTRYYVSQAVVFLAAKYRWPPNINVAVMTSTKDYNY